VTDAALKALRYSCHAAVIEAALKGLRYDRHTAAVTPQLLQSWRRPFKPARQLRSASAGGTRLACRAGIAHAIDTTASSAAETHANVIGSCAPTS